MKRLIFVGMLMAIGAVCFGRTFIYRNTIGRDSSYSVLIETKSDVPNLRRVILTNDNERHDAIVTADGSVIELRYQNIRDRTDYTAKRVGNRILVTGKLKGRPLSRTVNIDSKRWGHIIQYTAAYLARSDRRDMRFWLLRPDDATAHVFVAQRLANEEITVDGAKVDTVKVRITLSGFASMFFESFYWLRARDYVYVRGHRRTIGQQDVVAELVEERD